MKLTGHEAIEYAEANDVALNKYEDPTEDAREGVTPDEARKIAREDPSLIWINAEVSAWEPREEVQAIQADTARIREVREELEALRCECDYEAQGDPLEYVKTSRYCPVHDMCESCMEVLGVIKDPSPLPTDKRPYWLCLACSKLCNECGDDPCKCVATEPADPIMTAAEEREFARGFDEAHARSEER